ncbi:DUF2867 domain-containing protein [Variovorax sp. RT4R15]|uniref:DUF2867 domain-containing protein n=1 Tax=Variovorax sp. RT4R15 TaxID=3443737 RepID=UPI003F48FA97
MPAPPHRAHAVALPTGVRVARLYPGASLADAFAIDLPPGTTHDVLALARCALERPAPWVDRLMAVRDAIVSLFGLKTARALRADNGAASPPRVGIFRIYETLPDEVVLGEDDRHLDFRVSVQRSAGQLTAVTVVHCHNLLGRTHPRDRTVPPLGGALGAKPRRASWLARCGSLRFPASD